MVSPRDVLNELKWTGADLAAIEIWYVHRGAPNDRRVVRASAIREVGRSFFSVEGERGGASIPFHRVVRIARGETVLFERARPADAGDRDLR